MLSRSVGATLRGHLLIDQAGNRLSCAGSVKPCGQLVSPDRDVEINPKLESLGIGYSGLFDVVFRQEYISPNYQDNVRKRLFLLREADGLKIWKEEVLP